jgi:hypothetical protein
MSGQMELELELGLKERSTNAYMAFSERLPNISNARESGGTQSVFLKRKVMFKGPLIKNLDEDILAKDDTSRRHQIAIKAIANLRNKKITEINELLAVLGPRHTSWPRDIAIISGLLVGVEIPANASQQDIYQRTLRKEVSQSFPWTSLPQLSNHV